MEEAHLIQKAFDLQDEGYGSYTRCLKILQAYKGDVVGARDVLSAITMNDFNG